MCLAENTVSSWSNLSVFCKLGLNNKGCILRCITARENHKAMVFCKPFHPGRLAASENSKFTVFQKLFHALPGPAVWHNIHLQKTSLVEQWPICSKLSIHSFAGLYHNTAVDHSKLGRRAERQRAATQICQRLSWRSQWHHPPGRSNYGSIISGALAASLQARAPLAPLPVDLNQTGSGFKFINPLPALHWHYTWHQASGTS